MIAPTEADIGRKVVYRSLPDAEPEEGIISSLGPDRVAGTAVFVRFRGPTGELTRCCSLEWIA